jgi:hypothetical protein
MSIKEFYKERHPEYFSDSEVIEIHETDKSLLDHHLSTLGSRSQEIDFERFARRVCEKEICPNLIPTTGPLGGGDSKVDSETHSVSETLALKWYGNISTDASTQRWAFAFSTQKTWVPKLKSDLEKALETERGYTKIFFVTNQSIPAKKRSETEDKLKNEYKIDVTILDKTWLIEKVFINSYQDIAIEELKMSSTIKKEEKKGVLDLQKIDELGTLESKINLRIESEEFGIPIVDYALEAADLCRKLEQPKEKVMGTYARAENLALKYGGLRQQIESAYQLGWTMFWWFEDIDAAVKQYEILEERVKQSSNIYDYELLVNLHTVLSKYAEDNRNDHCTDGFLKPIICAGAK